MISRKLILHITCFGLSATVLQALADDTPPAPTFTVGMGAQSAPRYSGSDQRHWLVAPVIQARDGAFFFDSLKGVGYDLQADNGLYLEHTLGYGLGRTDRNSTWRDGSNKLKGMGNIDATMNTALAVGWSATPWLSFEGKATLPLTDSQGAHYQTSVTLLPVQNDTDTVALQSAALFGDRRYMNTFYGVSREQSSRTDFAPYQSDGGFYGVDSSLTWSHQFTSHWGAVVSADYTWLDDKAGNSPIVVKRGGMTYNLGVLYTF
ncbi:MipA/OmpV family protein [Rahnella victoriana]|jgi:outer membrane scaffolding protein for murein synthesis (MipA/OmpV family)|uniref:MipA/OmpV family protein n=1 Tax=Rahnella victoriana TaxID=1510570 RepID=A0ABS0DMZ8_9GAMM|nr:MipA/OmpV family protein [Rahnella victoriana]MBF7955282.1 MipA/OmpV family protein [Rahnella victoriana]PBI78693.1 MltA-interacting MipA family protein [Rahnella victoriana]TBX34866.1 MipA/OmpV family protein [Rahnella victoriana]VTQ54555.1 MltA-interacting protein MipA [Campylobacter jejuni]